MFPDGRIGSDPSLATIEAGREIYATAVREIVDDYLTFMGSTDQSNQP